MKTLMLLPVLAVAAASPALAESCSTAAARVTIAKTLRLAAEQRPVNITFQTRGDGVKMPESLKAKYSDDMGVASAVRLEVSRGEHRMPCIRSARLFRVACAALLALALSPVSAGATSRIKDLANIEGVRQNQLIGYGLVVGLNGTGDTLNNIPFTKQSLQAMLERMR